MFTENLNLNHSDVVADVQMPTVTTANQNLDTGFGGIPSSLATCHTTGGCAG